MGRATAGLPSPMPARMRGPAANAMTRDGAIPGEADAAGGREGPMSLLELPEDIVFLLLSYLDARSLGRVAQTCGKLRRLCGRDCVWRRVARMAINTGITDDGTDRCVRVPLKERVRVSQNWRRGRCQRESLLRWRHNLLPWLQLEEGGAALFVSQAEEVLALRLHARRGGGGAASGRVDRRPVRLYRGHRDDVCQFVINRGHLVSGGSDGRIVVQPLCGAHRHFAVAAHEEQVNCIDSGRDVIVSGSRDRTAKVWSLLNDRTSECLHTIDTQDRVWSVAISPAHSSFVTGTACCGHHAPLRIWDLQRGDLLGSLGSEFRHGAGVLGVQFETPSVLLSCGHDTFLRLWDTRSSMRQCVREWEEPHDSALYCLQADGNHMVASGSAHYGVVRLWDKRHHRCLQTFNLASPVSSPVYSLRFSTRCLYVAVATQVCVLDFT
ncbi:F-box/WD repeat-containing protein 4 isoform X2 [Petromyzon marinus]|uniref:F-box/WD repeat-containing protein 4 isoform X2 n=1 Tax=Petromyzon marinus TaxID=7757 RepID=UPI003F70E298